MRYIITWQEYDSLTFSSSEVLRIEELAHELIKIQRESDVDKETIQVHNIQVKLK